MNRRVLGWLLLSVLAIAVIAVELCLRFLGFGHPLLYKATSSGGYELVAGQTVNRFRKFTHINTLGTRGPETKPMPGYGIYRILVLGDSVANGGALINDDDTWPMQLQTCLSKRASFEVVNASVSGWAVPNEAAWLVEHGTLGAKLILLEVNEDDLDQSFVKSDLLDANISFPSKMPPTALGELLKRYIFPRLGLGAAPSADPGSTEGMFRPQNTTVVLDSVETIRLRAERGGGQTTYLILGSTRANSA